MTATSQLPTQRRQASMYLQSFFVPSFTSSLVLVIHSSVVDRIHVVKCNESVRLCFKKNVKGVPSFIIVFLINIFVNTSNEHCD